jgi:glyoxylase-like metal-dependent hydrolase (beta-lactamase superfamily II)
MRDEPVRWTIGAIELVRVADPGFDLVLPSDEATAGSLRSSGWLHPCYVTDDMALRIGSSTIVVRTPSALIVVDPFLAFDDPARLAPRMAALRAAGVDHDAVDIVVLSHIDGIGTSVAADGSPSFPAAQYLVPAAELDDARRGKHGDAGQALVALQDKGLVESIDRPGPVVPGVHLEDAPGHNPGHVVTWIESGGSTAVVAGHLFLHPAQVADPAVERGDLDPVALAATRRALLTRSADEDALLLAPLFAAPGGGHVETDGSTWRLRPA